MSKSKRHSIRLLFFTVVAAISLLAAAFLMPKKEAQPPLSEMTQIPPDVGAAGNEVPQTNVLPAKAIKLPILMYHYIEYVRDTGDTIRQSLNIYPTTFEAQIKTLQGAGYTFITMSDLTDKKKPLPQKPIVLTFDDGYRDFYTYVFPILKKYNVRAVAYIVPGFFNRPNNMDKWQIQEVVKSGLVEIGAHTVDHVYLAGMSQPLARDQIVRSKIILEQELRVPVTAFAYPYGAFNLQTIQLVRDAGFTTAVSTIQGVEVGSENQFYLFRVRPGARTGAGLISYLDQLKGAN